MKELSSIRDSFETRGGDTPAERCEDGDRLLRLALSIGDVIRISSTSADAATRAYERAVEFDELGGERRFQPDEVVLLADVLARIEERLALGLDLEQRPRGDVGGYIKEEASMPKTFPDGEADLERVFEFASDGTLLTVYPRIPLARFRDELPRFIAYFQRAASRKQEIAFVEE